MFLHVSSQILSFLFSVLSFCPDFPNQPINQSVTVFLTMITSKDYFHIGSPLSGELHCLLTTLVINRASLTIFMHQKELIFFFLIFALKHPLESQQGNFRCIFEKKKKDICLDIFVWLYKY